MNRVHAQDFGHDRVFMPLVNASGINQDHALNPMNEPLIDIQLCFCEHDNVDAVLITLGITLVLHYYHTNPVSNNNGMTS